MSFKSWRSYWKFSDSVLSKYRYVMDDESKAFLNSLLVTCKDREKNLSAGTIAWRAQNGHLWRPCYQHSPDTNESIYIDDLPCPLSFERMKPLANSATEGRANSKGIPCLYLATDKETAMSEVRPWIGGIMTVSRFRILKDIKLIDFSIGHGKNIFYINEPTDEKKIESVWNCIDNAFSKPIRPSDTKSDYAPTQIISELIKSNGYDGIAYKSSLATGCNIALFDLELAEVFDCHLFEASKIEYAFKEIYE